MARERRTCSIANGRCKAPAGIRTYSGIGEGFGSCRGTCVVCGEPVCSGPLCSRRLKKGRTCYSCAGEPEKWVDDLRRKERS